MTKSCYLTQLFAMYYYLITKTKDYWKLKASTLTCLKDHPGKGEKLPFSLSGNIGCNNVFTWLYIALRHLDTCRGANVEGIL
ncbi:hypothetical protein SLA2020_074030 [Shorea laevis]